MTTDTASKYGAMDQQINQWAYTCLSSMGYTLKCKVPEKVQNTPWSKVARFETSDGYIYLKNTPKLLALEAHITQILHDQFQANVPEIIAHNDHLHCFLMKDAGRTLRDILKKQFDATLYCKAINQFTSMQLAVADHVTVLLDVGVPDWRLDQLPDVYMQLLSQKKLIIADGLTEKEISELEALLPTLRTLCHKLSEYGIKQSIVQPDFHDNNILIAEKSQHITFIDLGEIAISHPFLSLSNCLHQAKRHHALTDKDDAYLQLMDACLEHFTNFCTKKNLLDAFFIAQQLTCIYDALSFYRLMEACDITSLASYCTTGRLSTHLKAFITACRQKN